MHRSKRKLALGTLLAAALVVGGCTSDDDVVGDGLVDDEFADDDFGDDESGDDEFVDDEFVDDEFADDEFAEQDAVPDASVEDQPAAAAGTGTRSDVECTADGLGEDDEFQFTTAYFVTDGVLGALCHGDDDERLRAAWSTLATITPQGQLADLGLFGGFGSTTAGAESTLAFVNALDDDGSLFQMSVNVEAYEEDPVEAKVTLAHEFAHVFTSIPSQLDRTAEAIDSCETYDNGEGCYTESSIMAQWIELFWGDGLIDEIDPFEEADPENGVERCDLNGGFFGPYAASSPEEDFAESFGAYVFDVEGVSAEQQLRLDWIAAQPGLAEFRQRAVDAGLTPVPNTFEPCG